MGTGTQTLRSIVAAFLSRAAGTATGSSPGEGRAGRLSSSFFASLSCGEGEALRGFWRELRGVTAGTGKDQAAWLREGDLLRSSSRV